MDFASRTTELLWIGGLAAVPLTITVALLCRLCRWRPATRHSLWCAALLSFLTPALAALLWQPDWFASHRILAAADSLARMADGSVAPKIASHAAAPAPTPAPAPIPSPSAILHPPVRPAVAIEPAPAGTGTNPLRGTFESIDQVAAITEWLAAHQSDPATPALAAAQTPSLVSRPSAGTEPGLWTESGSSRHSQRPATSTPRSRDRASESGWRTSRGQSTDLGTMPPRAAPATDTTIPPSARAFYFRPGAPSNSSAAPTAAAATPREAAPAPSATRRSWTKDAKAWLSQALEVRDTVSLLPPIPWPVWAAGTGLIVLVWTIRLLLAARLIRRATPAPDDMARLVRRAAIRLGMRRAPRTLVSSDRISPTIWCGRRPTLVIPDGLWHELDQRSRYAVVVHELAHLRRRDHWFCWLESLVGALYWWHPVAWWARRRVRDEADLCCDAWVTTLLPQSRRAYAEALVITKSYLSLPGGRVTPGLGVMTSRTKRLARRLTMVMTQRVAPRTSVMGVAIALTVAGAGMFVTPGLACPPDSQQQKAAVKAQMDKAMAAELKAKARADKVKDKAEKAEKTAKARAEAKPETGVEFFGEAPALEAMKRARAGGDPVISPSEEEQLRKLEEQLKVIERRIEKLYEKAGQQHSSLGTGTTTTITPSVVRSIRPGEAVMLTRSIPPVTVTEPAAPRSPYAVTMAGPAPTTPTPPAPPRSPHGVTMVAPAAPTPVAIPGTPAPPAQPTPRAFAGPRGMSQLSVPRGSLNAQSDDTRAYSLPSGKLEALTELMSREDVPVLIEKHPDHIVVHGNAQQQRIFAAFVQLINPESPAGEAAPLSELRIDTGGQTLRGMNLQLDPLRSSLERLTVQRAELDRAADGMRRRADQMREKAEKLREKGETLKEKLESQGYSDDHRDVRAAQAMIEEAEAIEAAAGQTDGQADDLESQVDQLEAQTDDIDAQIDELAGQLEEDADNDSAGNDEVEVDVEVSGDCDSDDGDAKDCDSKDCNSKDCDSDDDSDHETSEDTESTETADGGCR